MTLVKGSFCNFCDVLVLGWKKLLVIIMYVTFCFSSRTVSLKKHPGRSECYDHSSLCQECQVSTVSHFQYSNDICKGEEHLFSGLQVVLKSILKALAPLMQIGLLVNIVFTIREGVKNEEKNRRLLPFRVGAPPPLQWHFFADTFCLKKQYL